MKRITLLVATAASFFTTPVLLAQMNHGDMGGMDHGAHQQDANAHTEQAPALPKPVQAVLTNYLNIQIALAQDSLQGVSASATAIAKSVQSDSAKTLPAAIAQQAETLAKAGDIKVVREAFKPLSESLTKYLDANHAGHYVKVFCPMANAKWLQTGKVVNNPYFGKSMARCGEIER